MKTNSFFLTILFFISSIVNVFSQNPFIIKFDLTSGSTTVTIPISGTGTYNYDIDWNNNGTWTNYTTANPSHNFGSAGQYTINIRGTFPKINFNNSAADKDRLEEILQWGDIAWTDMTNSFYGCTNLTVSATDAPDLSGVTSLASMFRGCENLNSDFNHWDVSNITNMASIFRDCEVFNGDISDWDVSNVTTMTYMFFNSKDFNQDIGDWDVSNVENMQQMFVNAEEFNQDISDWDVSNVLYLSGMFQGARKFNQPIGSWTINSGVTNMSNMFYIAKVFNQDLSNWDVSNVTNMSSMFRDAWAFNSNLVWDVGSVTNMSDMFRTAKVFNKELDWDVSSVTNMSGMFRDAYNFDQNLGGWDVSSVENMTNMFGTTNGLSVANYDNTLIGWSSLTLQPNVTFDAGTSKYCIAIPERYQMINVVDGWTINDDGFACGDGAFITKWKTDNTGSSTSTQISIPTTGSGYDYHIDWESDGVFDDVNVTGNITHTYASAGTYTVTIFGDFPRIYFNYTGDKYKILDIEQWGDIEWTSMYAAFSGCSNLEMSATDAPDLSAVNNCFGTFEYCSIFNGDISNWNTGNVTNMSNMFYGATNFNQDIGDWNVENVTEMISMFSFATSFDQNLGNWDVSEVTDMSGMFGGGAGLSTANYDLTLIGWEALTLQSYVTFDAGTSMYCAAASERADIISNDYWTIYDAGSGTCRLSTNIKNEENESDLYSVIYPNPTIGMLNFNFKESSLKNILVLNIYGQVIKTTNTVDKSFRLDLSDLSSGIYVVEIIEDERKESVRIVKN